MFNEEFNNREIINQVNYLRGVQYILNGYNACQGEIKRFIANCKENENEEGF